MGYMLLNFESQNKPFSRKLLSGTITATRKVTDTTTVVAAYLRPCDWEEDEGWHPVLMLGTTSLCVLLC